MVWFGVINPTFESPEGFRDVTGHVGGLLTPPSMQPVLELFGAESSVSWPSDTVVR